MATARDGSRPRGRLRAGRSRCATIPCAYLTTSCTRNRGYSVHPAFPAPSDFEGETGQASDAMRRGNADLCPA